MCPRPPLNKMRTLQPRHGEGEAAGETPSYVPSQWLQLQLSGRGESHDGQGRERSDTLFHGHVISLTLETSQWMPLHQTPHARP